MTSRDRRSDPSEPLEERSAPAPSPGAASLASRGRARRAALEGRRELWRFDAAEEALAARLRALGEVGVGGFVDAGLDAEGPWLVREARAAPLADLLRARAPTPPELALALALPLARGLAACERARLFPGPLTPDTVDAHAAVDADAPPRGPAITLRAEPLVAALVGEPPPMDTHATSPLWTPPEQADDAPWDAAANRYALGLVLYRLLAGSHPFGGAGLRHALADAAHREPPPMADEVASTLPPGLQSLVLRMLRPEASRRPVSAQAIADELARFVELPAGAARAPSDLREPAAPKRPPRAPAPRGEKARDGRETKPRRRVRRPRSPLAGRAARAPWPGRAHRSARRGGCRRPRRGGALRLHAGRAASRAVTVAAAQPLTDARSIASDCAGCHDRQASEWRRSVMAHSVKSPLFNALESLIEEQVGRDDACPGGAGVLRRASAATACRDPQSNLPVTGSGGEHWCVSCHSPLENLAPAMPIWDGRAGGDAATRRPVRDLLGARAMEGIGCTFCHSVHGPVGRRGSGRYEGNATWTSFTTGAVFAARPEDDRGLTGIGNSGYDLRREELLLLARPSPLVPRGSPSEGPARGLSSDGGASASADLRGAIDPIVHARPTPQARGYLASSAFCGACHDVRLFGTDVLGAPKGEHFKRLRNAYSEWAAWADGERRQGRAPASCQDCHMSTFPAVCEPGEPDARETSSSSDACPSSMHAAPRRPGSYPDDRVASSSPRAGPVTTHFFSGVDVPLAEELGDALIDEPSIDAHGMPTSLKRRRNLLLRATFRFELGAARATGGALEIPLTLENVGAGHRVPAGFSQEREVWVHLVVKDAGGRVLYEVGRVDRGDEDLRDKVMDRVTTRADRLDARGRPEGLFGADVRDGPDAPRWQPPPALGGATFRGLGLINLQNGFLRCVKCIGNVAADGSCAPNPGQETHRADRFADGAYDLDTGACTSNLVGANALFETYFPVGALDASRGGVKGPDAIVDTRSAPPGVPLRYTYVVPSSGRGPFHVEAELLFRAFPPYLVRAFADYEREQARRGLRPTGPLVTSDMLRKLEVVKLARVTAEIRG